MLFPRFFVSAATAILIGGGLAALAPSASAAPVAPSYVSLDRAGVFSYSSTLTVDGKVLSASHTLVAINRVTPASGPGQGPAGASLHCNQLYNFGDPNGNYVIQHQCGGRTAPWGYQINIPTCSKATSPVTESGMAWARNGATQGTQAPHVEPCNYQFHGTYNPDLDYDHIAYSDVLKWTVGGGGHAVLQIYGSFTISGSPCSPTSC